MNLKTVICRDHSKLTVHKLIASRGLRSSVPSFEGALSRSALPTHLTFAFQCLLSLQSATREDGILQHLPLHFQLLSPNAKPTTDTLFWSSRMIVKFSISRIYMREDELLFCIFLNPSSFHLLVLNGDGSTVRC